MNSFHLLTLFCNPEFPNLSPILPDEEGRLN